MINIAMYKILKKILIKTLVNEKLLCNVFVFQKFYLNLRQIFKSIKHEI